MSVSELIHGYGGRKTENRSMVTRIQRGKTALFLELSNAYGSY